MAEEKSEGFFKRVFGRFGGKKDAPEQVEQETVAPEAVPQAPKSAPDPALAEARVETPSAKAKPAPKKKKVEAKAPTTRKTPAKKPVEKKAPAKKTRPEKLAEKPAAKKTPAAKETKPVAAPKAVESEGMPVAKVPAKKATPRPKPKPKPKPKSKPKPAPEPELKPVIEPKPEPAPEPVPAPAPVPEKPSPPPEPVPPPQPAPIQAPEPEPVSEPVATPEPAPPAEEPAKKKGWFSRLKEGLARSSNQLTENITAVFTKRKLDDDTLQELEDVLIQADLGVETAMKITEEVARGRFNKEISDQEIREILGAEVAKVLGHVAKPLAINSANRPHIILVVGVNGTGKTTTIGKLAAKFRGEGKSVMLAAGDTFRAAAID
ncbi:MAG: signal recognition particle receptor subunit alpha, partial [Fimbriimonadaceae bacterium]|nr:signal recognition particle receptor subunit alpha [Alphaproteobacteria bacterium]